MRPLRVCWTTGENMISLACVNINEQAKKNVNEALNDGRIAQGKFVKEFQDKMKDYLGVKHAFFVANGTLADAVALASLKAMKPDKDEVILPAFTFIAQANAVLMAGLKPVFVDAKEYDFQIDINKIKEKITDKTLAIFPAHLLGYCSNMEQVNKIAFENNLFVVEDVCESLGATSSYGKKAGTTGDVGTYSFFVSHTISTGEGGLIVTDNDKMADMISSIMNHGRKSEQTLDKFQFPYFGFNAKGTNLSAAIGCSLVDTIDDVIKARQDNVTYLDEKLKPYSPVFKNLENSSPHCYPIKAEPVGNRDDIILKLTKAGIECRTLYNSILNNTYLSNGSQEFPNALNYSTHYYFIPCHQNLTKKDLDYMIKKIKNK